MHKFFATAVAAAALSLTAAAANAGTLLFQFDEANSSISVANSCDVGVCGLIGSLYNPISDLDLGEGETGEFTFGKLTAWGAGWDSNAQITLNLAFSNPVGASFGNNANVGYATFFGLVSKGKIDWAQNSQVVTASNGTQFTVAFKDEAGLAFGSKDLKASLTLNSVVPEPATWGLMIGGFGMAGATLRRRRAMLAA